MYMDQMSAGLTFTHAVFVALRWCNIETLYASIVN